MVVYGHKGGDGLNTEDIVSIITTVFSSVVVTLTLTTIYNKLTLKAAAEEKSEVENDPNRVKPDDNLDVIGLMLKNVKELRQYYIISKQQATRSFSSAILMSIVGVVIYFIGIFAVIILKADIAIITIIAGTVVELVSGLSFWLYSQSTKQLNIYHKRLTSTEKYLMAIQMIDKVPEERKYEEYRNVINYILNDNQVEIKNSIAANMLAVK